MEIIRFIKPQDHAQVQAFWQQLRQETCCGRARSPAGNRTEESNARIERIP